MGLVGFSAGLSFLCLLGLAAPNSLHLAARRDTTFDMDFLGVLLNDEWSHVLTEQLVVGQVLIVFISKLIVHILQPVALTDFF